MIIGMKNTVMHVKDVIGKLSTNSMDQLQREFENFIAVFKPPTPHIIPLYRKFNGLARPILCEIEMAIRNSKNGKSTVVEGIAPKMLNADPTMAARILYALLKTTLDNEQNGYMKFWKRYRKKE